MLSIADYRAHLIRADYGLIALVLIVLTVLVALVVLARRWAFLGGLGRGLDGRLWLYGLRINQSWYTVLGALALALRVPFLLESLWYDEAFSFRIAMMPFGQLGPAIISDVHPPTYYGLIWLWARLAPGLSGPALWAWLRLPSLAFGLLAIYLVHRLAVALGLGLVAAFVAALLVALTPASIYYSTEMRNYSMLICALLGALVCIWEDRPGGFVVCLAALGWLHNLGLLYVPVVALVALIVHWQKYDWCYTFDSWSSHIGEVVVRDQRRPWVIAIVAGGLLSLVWLPLLIRQSGAISDGFWIYFNAGTPFWSLALNLMYVPRELIFLLLLPVIGLSALGFYLVRDWLRRFNGGLILLVLVGPPSLSILLSIFWAPVYLPRSFVPLNLLALIPLAIALVRFPRLLLVWLALAFVGVVSYIRTENLLRPDFAGMMAAGCAGADAIYYTAIDTAITIAPVDGGRPALVWAGGRDRGLTFKIDELPVLDFSAGDITQFAGRVVCVPYLLTPRTVEPERAYVAELMQTYGAKVTRYVPYDDLDVDLILLTVPGAAHASR